MENIQECPIDFSTCQYKKGIFNVKLDGNYYKKKIRSSTISSLEYFNDSIEEGVAGIHKKDNCVYYLYKLQPTKIMMDVPYEFITRYRLSGLNKYITYWTNECYFIFNYYSDKLFYLYVVQDKEKLPMLMTNIFDSSSSIMSIFGNKTYRADKICFGKSLYGQNLYKYAIDFHKVILTFLKAQPDSDLNFVRQFYRLKMCRIATLSELIYWVYYDLQKKQANIKTREEAKKWYEEKFDTWTENIVKKYTCTK